MKKLAAILPVLFVSVGCSMFDGRKDYPAVTGFTPDNLPAMTTTPVDADYVLYRGDSDSPIARHHLKPGEPIGFKRDALDSMGKPVGAKGTVSAVAGEMSLPINPTEKYEWRRLPSSSSEDKASNPWMPRN